MRLNPFNKNQHTAIPEHGHSSRHVQEEDHNVAVHAAIGVAVFTLFMLVIAAISFIYGQ